MIKSTEIITAELCNTCDGANVFFSHSYAKLVRSLGKQIIYCYSNKYIIPVVITNKLLFKYGILMSEPYVFATKDAECEEDESSFLNDLSDYLKKSVKLQWLLPTPASAFFNAFPQGVIKIPFGSHVIDLSLDEEILWKNLHSKHRNVIKKAEKDGVVVQCGINKSLINDYNKMDIETWNRSNKSAIGKSVYQSMVENMPENCVIYIAYLNGDPQSGAVLYFNKIMCYYMYGANKNNPHTGSGNLLQWRVIMDMKNNGVKNYSFVGCRINEDINSKYHGIQRFKERFGGELKKGYMFKKIYNKWAYEAFDLLVGIANFIHTGHFGKINDIIDQELHKWN